MACRIFQCQSNSTERPTSRDNTLHCCDTGRLSSPQGQIKDIQRELDEARAAQKETLNNARESERRAKGIETDLMQLQEVLMHHLDVKFKGFT